jgi:succinoglycan biosynthesis transport protein ExoP
VTAETTQPAAPRPIGHTMDRPDAGGSGNTIIWTTVRKHWATAAATAIAITLAVTFYTLGQTKIYQAAATIQFDPNPPRPLGAKVETIVDMGSGSYWDNHEYYETQYKIITSTRVTVAVVAQLGLNHDASFLKNAPPGVQVPATETSEEGAAQALRSRLKVEPIKDSRLALVKLEDADPDRAQRVLAALVDTYITMNLEDARASTTDAGVWLRKQLDSLKNELETSEKDLFAYKEDKNILSLALDDQSNMLREEMKQLNESLTAVRTKREEVAARAAELAKVRADNPSKLPASELLHSAVLQGLRHSYEDAVRERDGLIKSGKGKNHPEVLAVQGKLDASREALLAEVRNIQGALDGDLSVIKRQEAGLSGLFEGARKKAFELNRLEIDYNRLRRSKENNEKLYALVLERTKESDLSRMLSVNNVRVLDSPLRPGAPVRPQVPLNIGTGVFVGILLGIAAAMARAMLDRSVKTPDDLERDMGISFLGLLPEIGNLKKDLATPRYARHRRKGAPLGQPGSLELLVHNYPMSGLAEASRTIRTNLLFMAPDHPFRTLLITSAGPSEGKTTVACCIAIAMAQAGQRVLLIDCDLRKPRLHRVFGYKGNSAGLTTALVKEDGDDLSGIIHSTEVPNMSIITAGPIPPNPAELFHSERFRAFLEKVQGKFDRVILDSPPIVAVTDAVILSTLVDGTMLVVRAFKTPKDMVRHALRSLIDVGANTAGTVLNSVNLDRSEYKYSHYYYYRKDGYYAEDGPSSSGGAGSSHEEASQAPS